VQYLQQETGYKTCMKPFHFLSVVFILVCMVGMQGDAFSQSTTATEHSSYTVLPQTVNRKQMLKLVNDIRKKGCQCGDTYYNPAPPVAWNSLLEEAAYKHSTNMYNKKFFSHAAPDGSRGGTRLERVGYAWKLFGENIGEGYKTEKEMIDGWLASPGHCKNIMKKEFKEMGVARAGNLWTQEFGAR
jgi:uncharacterized protein YkwD